MKKLITYSFIGLTALFSSCANPDIEEMVASIDSSYVDVQNAELQLLAMDTSEIGKMMRYNTKSLDFIQTNFTDTATKLQSIFISDISAVRRSFSKLIGQRESLIDDMVYAKSQLNDIKKDVSNGIVAKTDFQEYFTIEKQAIDLFISTVESSIIWNNSNTKRFETMKPKIEKFIEEINISDS